MFKNLQGRELPALLAGLILSAAIFWFSLSQPPEVATNIAFVTTIIIGLLAHSCRLVVSFTFLSILLILSGAIIAPGDTGALLATTNNMLALFIMASVGGTCYLALNEQEQLNQQLREAAERDPLTRLYNRRVMMKQLGINLAQAVRYRSPLAVMILDVDNFKNINDEYGHMVGDEILRVLSKICSRAVREADILCRYGGEEFAVLCPHTGRAGALAAAERIRRDIADQHIIVGKDSHRITVSIGVATLSPEHGTEETLLKIADDGLYEAKRKGRNQVVCLQPAEKASLAG